MEKYIVTLTQDEREYLLSLIKKGKSRASMLAHARVFLAIDESSPEFSHQTDNELALELYVSPKFINRARRKFIEEGLEAAITRKAYPKTRIPKIQGNAEAHLIALCCSSPPEGRSRWTLKLLANADFVCKMEDILDVYQRHYDEEFPVISMDETNKQLIKEVRPSLQMIPGQSIRYDAEYERVGVCNIFFSFEPLKGRRRIKVTDTRGKLDWAYFIKEIVGHDYPNAKKIILVLDNLNTHRGASLYEAFPPEEAKRILDRLEIHYTPNHGSWLNMSEIELSHLSRQCLNRRICSKDQFIKEVSAWVKERNEEKCFIDWRFTTSDARIKLKRLYPMHITGQNY